jgi:hypothetical protein
LVTDIVTTYANHPSPGIIGVKALLPTLSAVNQSQGVVVVLLVLHAPVA